jgi:hypothetical protein
MNRVTAPPSWSTEVDSLQGKSRRVQGSAPFGGSNGLICLSSFVRDKYCHNGGMAFRPSSRRDATAGGCGGP